MNNPLNETVKTDAVQAPLTTVDLPEFNPVIEIPVVEESTAELIDDTPVVPPVIEPVVETPQPIIIETLAVQRKKQNVTAEYPSTRTDGWDESADTLAFPSNFDTETRKVLNDLPNVNLIDSQESRQWANVLKDGVEHTTFMETFTGSLEEEGADFRQAVDYNGTPLGGQQPKFKPIEGQNLKGERAVIRIMSHLGLGTLFQAPLWHTGIWVTFKAPSEAEIIELNRVLVSDKIIFGRYTYGLAFSNITSYTIDRLVDFALDHVYDTTLATEALANNSLKNIIASQDIPSLLWGFVCTMYPRGFQIRRSCINDPEKCNHVLEEQLNVSKLHWINSAALTDWQKTHMSIRRANSKDLASVTRYKEEMVKTQTRRMSFNEGLPSEIQITLKSPTVAEYVDSGHRWIGEIVEVVNKTLGMDGSDSERNTFITRHGQASSMRQYSHWVKSIELDTNIIDDLDTIETSFNTLSADNGIRNKFMEAVSNYIEQSTISVIGIPVYECPNCGTVQEPTKSLPLHKNLIPLDVVQLFFGLLSQRLAKLTER